MRHTIRLILILTAAALYGCLSLEEYDRLLEEALHCSQDSDCVTAGIDSGCTCLTLVNRQSKEKVDRAAAAVRCGGAMVECPVLGTPVCREGICDSDFGSGE